MRVLGGDGEDDEATQEEGLMVVVPGLEGGKMEIAFMTAMS